MTSIFAMPSLGADMAAGILVQWQRAPGDVVHRGDIIASVETDKGVIDVEVFTDGTIGELLVEPGQEVPVGTPLATIVDGDGAHVGAVTAAPPVAPGPPPPIPVSPLARELLAAAHVAVTDVHGSGPHGRIVRRDVRDAVAPEAPEPAGAGSTPRSRELAARYELDLATVHGTGPRGRVLAADVEALVAARAPAVPADPALRMRRAIAAAMSKANREIPHYHVATTIDLERATAWLEQANAERPLPQRLLLAALLAKASALALRRHPNLNGLWRDDALERADHVHLGVIVALRGGGLVAPALHDADQLPLDAIMAGLRDLVMRSRAGSLRSSDLADSTATMTSLGDGGVDEVHGVIFPPQVAIIGFGGVVRRPWVVDDAVVPRLVVRATLAADHRATDGHVGSGFLTALDSLLQRPEEL